MDDLSCQNSPGEVPDSQEESGDILSSLREPMPTPTLAAIGSSTSGVKKNASKTMGRPKSQLTPRMALYIPPHLQRQTQQAQGALKKSIPKSKPMPTAQQIEQEKLLRTKLEEFTRDYAGKQFQKAIASTYSANEVHFFEKANMDQKTKPRISAESWTPEMKSLLECKKSNLMKFNDTGAVNYLHESKKAKIKLRKLLRNARSTKSKFPNIYENLKNFHAQFNTCEPSERSRNTSCSPPTVTEDNSFDGEDFVSARVQIQQAQNEWCESIISYMAKTSSKKLTLADVVKVEVIDSDEESQNAADSDVCVVRYGRYGDGDAPQAASSRRPDGTADSSSLDASNNEYLNQQFLRRQHDYEREQKYKQISSEARTRRSSPETFDDSLREYCQSGNRKINFDSIRRPSGIHARSPEVLSSPLFPIHPAFDNLEYLRVPEEVPREPFVKERRLKIYSPSIEISPAVRDSNVNRFSNSEHSTDDPHRCHSGRMDENPRKDSCEREVYVRNYSYGGIEEYPVREVSPYSSEVLHNESHHRRERSLRDTSRSKSRERRVARTSNHPYGSGVSAREVRRKEDPVMCYGSHGSMSERNSRKSDPQMLPNGEQQAYRNYVSYPIHSDDRGRKVREESNYPDKYGSSKFVADDGWLDRTVGYSDERNDRCARGERDGRHFVTSRNEMRSLPRARVGRDHLRLDTRMDDHSFPETRERSAHRSRPDASHREHPVSLLKHDLERIKRRSYESPERNRVDENHRKRKIHEVENTMRSAKKFRR